MKIQRRLTLGIGILFAMIVLLGIQSGGRPVCRHAEAGEPRPCECGLCNLTPAALSELICHLIATLPEDVIRLLRHSS